MLGQPAGLQPISQSFGDLFEDGGDGGIRTLDRALQPYNGLANRRLQPLGHVSGQADMPDGAPSRKRPISVRATLPVGINLVARCREFR
jgi:hypothetical protein